MMSESVDLRRVPGGDGSIVYGVPRTKQCAMAVLAEIQDLIDNPIEMLHAEL
jgi:uncharacterized protein YjfI (DUF2170 family)